MGAAGPKKLGRPAHSQQVIDEAKPKVQEALQTLGWRAGLPTLKVLLPGIPDRVLGRALQVLKAEHRAQEALERRQERVHVTVLAKGTVMAQDSTHVGNAKGRKAWAEVAKDAASTEARAFGDGKPVSGPAVLAHLKELKASDRLPLVWATDNGKAYTDGQVQAWLAQHQVIHLLSRPHTPTDNGRAERGIGEGKRLAGLGKGVLLQNASQGVQELDQALQTLNRHWPRTTKGGLTAAQLSRTLPHWRAHTTRRDFYNAACSAILAIDASSKRARRSQTREAIFRTLESFGLILRTRGELKSSYVKRDNIS